MIPRRGGPGDFDARRARCRELLASPTSAAEALMLLDRVLEHQQERAAAAQVATAVERLVVDEPRQRARHEFPLLAVGESTTALAAEVELAVEALTGDGLPSALGESGDDLCRLPVAERDALVAMWLDDAATVAAPVGFWCRVAGGPVFELAAAAVLPVPRTAFGRCCPVCGGSAQVSVIAEESGEFMAGSPRSLVCTRCATWWSFARATCPQCGEQDPRRVSGFVGNGDRAVRIDGCEVCHGYIKTFDLREPLSGGVVPLVDDVATLPLDLWARQHGFHRASPSFAGA